MERKWIIKTLKENDNCYVEDKNVDLKDIEKEIGCELTIRDSNKIDGGFVIEKKKVKKC